MRSLSRRYGVSDYSIRLVLLQAGVTLGKPRVTEVEQAAIQFLHKQGVSQLEIARRTGVPKSSVALVIAQPTSLNSS